MMFSEPPYTMSVCAELMPVPSVIKRWQILYKKIFLITWIDRLIYQSSNLSIQVSVFLTSSTVNAGSQTYLEKFQELISLSGLFRAPSVSTKIIWTLFCEARLANNLGKSPSFSVKEKRLTLRPRTSRIQDSSKLLRNLEHQKCVHFKWCCPILELCFDDDYSLCLLFFWSPWNLIECL